MTCEEIYIYVCKYLEFDIAEFTRKRDFTEARELYCQLCFIKATDYNLVKCGNAIKRHHATVMHALKNYKNPHYTNKYQNDYYIISEEIENEKRKRTRLKLYIERKQVRNRLKRIEKEIAETRK